MTVTITIANTTGQINVPAHLTANIASDIPVKLIQWTSLQNVNFTVSLDQKTINFTPSVNGVYTFRITVDGVSKDGTITVGTVTPPIPPVHTCPSGQHWDEAQQKCVPDVVNPPEPPTTGAKYDSNIQGKWNNGTARFVTDREGDVKANGFGFTVNASGGGGFRIDGKGQGNLEPASAGHRRIYIACCNYNARLEGEFAFLDSGPRNFSVKTRSRHQYRDEVDSKAADNKTQGGLGLDFSIEDQAVGIKTEVVHGKSSCCDSSKALPKKLEVGKWYGFKYTYKDKSSSEIDIKVELDYKDGAGFKTVLTSVIKPPSQFFNKSDFDTWSQFWLRLNDKGKIGTKNIRLFPL